MRYPPVLISFAKSNSYLILDTALFPPKFQTRLLSALSTEQSLDKITDGILIHSDNFQALNLLQARYREQVKCIYIDPPYNTEEDRAKGKFIYKDGFPSSSWATLIYNRLNLAKSLLSHDGMIFQSIDDNEQANLKLISDYIFGKDNLIANFLWKKKSTTSNVVGAEVSSQVDYQLCYRKSPKAKISQRIRHKETRNYPNSDDLGKYRVTVIEKKDSGDYKRDTMKFPILGYFPREGKRWQIGQDKAKELELKNRFIFDGEKIVLKVYDFEDKDTFSAQPNFLDNYGSSESASDILNNQLFGISELFNNPKPVELIGYCASVSADKNSTILDYFAGSGTTAHAVINLNREDGGKRKYILVEQGEYFDTVLKPRVQKVVYSEEWKDGKPLADKDSGSLNGVSQMVKVLKLESYEDTLNNLVLQNKSDLLSGLPESAQQDYLLHYMLDLESRDSLLSTDVFKKPFDYRLNIAADSAGAYVASGVDLVETFNYLLGLRVRGVEDKRFTDGYVLVEGWIKNPNEKILVVWRDCETWGYGRLPELLKKRRINPQDSEYEAVYINGDHTLPTAWQSDDGAENRTLKIVQIEAEFLRLMFGEA